MTHASTPEDPEDAKPTERLSAEPQPVEQQPAAGVQGPPLPPDQDATQALDPTQAFPPGTPPGATMPISHSMENPGQDATQAMPGVPPQQPAPYQEEETLSSSAHEPTYQQPPQGFDQPGQDYPTQAYAPQDYPPPNYPPQDYSGQNYPPQSYGAAPGPYGQYDQYGQYGQQPGQYPQGQFPPGQPQQGHPQPGRPRRKASRGAWFGVLLTLFLSVFASFGTVLVMTIWSAMTWGVSFGTAVQEVFSGLTSDFGGFMTILTDYFMALFVASILCLIATFLIPLTNPGARTVGILVLLGGAVTYTLGLIYGLNSGTFTGTFNRWSNFPDWWDNPNIGDLYLVPFFFLVTLIALGSTKPRKIR